MDRCLRARAKNHRVLLYVEPVRLAANHQLARIVDDLRLDVVHAPPDIVDRRGARSTEHGDTVVATISPRRRVEEAFHVNHWRAGVLAAGLGEAEEWDSAEGGAEDGQEEAVNVE